MSTWFTYNKGVTASGLRARLEPQAYYYWRGLGLMAEYAQDEHSLNLFTTNGFTKVRSTGPTPSPTPAIWRRLRTC